MSIENEINTPSEEQVTNQEQSENQSEEQQTTNEEPTEEAVISAEEEVTEEKNSPQLDPVEEAPPVIEPETEIKEDISSEVETADNQVEPEKQEPISQEPKEETSEESGAEDSQPEVDADAQETTEEVAKAEGGGEKEEEAITEEKPPLNPELQALIGRVDEALNSKDTHILEAISAPELTRLLLFYGQEEDITPLFPKVGLIKRSFDAINKEEIAEEDAAAFTTALEAFNKRRSDFLQQENISRAHNSERKKELILKLQELVNAEDPVRMQQEVRDLQDSWKHIGNVLDEDKETLNKQYRQLLDDFYKKRDMHFELLDYDRRINLQEKEKLIVEAGTLIPQEDERHDPVVWKQKMDMFTSIQQKWRSIGHVPRDEMDRINTAYREAIDKFFEIREDFKKLQDKIREENAEKKEEILRHMARFKEFTADKPKAWNDATRELRTYQEAWKQIGQAPSRKNNELWSRYREVCDAFFNTKSEYFKQFDDLRSDNLEKKRELCEKAEALKESTEWEKSARILKQLQRDWKTIGPVPERHSNKLWNRFRTACDAFFEGRRKHYESLHETEYNNLSAKRVLIEEIKNLKVEEAGSIEAAIQQVKDAQAKWKSIGKVPYKEKDNIWNEFRSVIDAFFDGLSLKREEMRDFKMKASIEEINDPDKRTRAIRSKITRLRRKIQSGQEKVDQYSNNILFIAKGKAGDPLRNQIQKEIDREKQMISEWRKGIKELNEMLRNPPKAEPAKEEKPAEEKPAEESKKVEEATAETDSASSETPTEAENVEKATTKTEEDSADEDDIAAESDTESEE